MKPGRIIFAVLLIAATWLLRSPGLDKKIWNVDEAVTFTMAQQILAGDVPYRDAVDQRTPLAPYVQAVVFAVSGTWNLRAQHAALALMIGLTGVLLWQTGRRLGEEAAGAVGAVWFTLLAFMIPSVRDTMPAHTAWYLVFFSTLGFWSLAAAWTSDRRTWALTAGVAFGFSFLAKQPGALDLGVALVLVALGASTAPGRWKRFARLGGLLVAGFTVPVVAAGCYFAARGAWADFLYYAWTYNHSLYVPEIPRLERWQTMRVPFDLAWEFNPAVVVIGVLAAGFLLLRVTQRIRLRPAEFDLPGWLILGWCAAGLISTTLSGRGFTHYSIQLVPGLSLACGWVTVRGWRAAATWAGASRPRRALAPVLAAGLMVSLLLPIPPRIRALDLPEPAADAIARLVQRHTAPAERIFVWGYTPEIYALSERLPAVRFLYNTFVTGLIPWTNLAPLTDTAYAIVPGAREKFIADWQAHTPALVADGRSQRGFMKYPLEKQAWLWPLIEKDYAQIAVDETTPLGFWLFRRVDAVNPGPLPANLPTGDNVRVRASIVPRGETARITVRCPPAAQAIDLYLDGLPYRRLAGPPGTLDGVTFFIPDADRSPGRNRIQAVAMGPGGARTASAEQELAIASAAKVIGGPGLDFEGRSIAALESSTIAGEPIQLKPDTPTHWDAHAPSRLVYPRLPGMNFLAFAFGLEEAALERMPPNHTDGIEVIVQVEDEGGRISQISRLRFDRETARRTRGLGFASTPLPPGDSGRIILLMTGGPDSAPAFDWSYWRWLRVARSPLGLRAGNELFHPSKITSPAALRQTEFNGQFITVAETPTIFEFTTLPGLDEVSGGFGLLDSAWFGRQGATPVDFTVVLVAPDGRETRLLERSLDPTHVPGDRGAQPFQIRLSAMTGTLRFSAQPRNAGVNADAFWSSLQGTRLRTSLRLPDGEIAPDSTSEGRFGFVNSVEDGRECLVAHAPASLVYPWREGMSRLTGEYGLISAAYLQRGTEGVVFTVEVQSADGHTREIFRRHLAPTTVPLDRGAQPLSVEIPRLPGGRLILRTLPPASGSLNAAWSYWRDLRAAP